ncbi:MAG TPA: GWxTD domain-containing protein [Acidobacteriota bacterium]|nr:GWxTD domain-containing protein [Acidobacteriota bacterium]
MKHFTSILVIILSCVPLFSQTRYQRWIDQEVRWIASRAETRIFKQLKSVEEKEAFIANFWKRRDPTPGTERNEYKEEFYRRWQYVNANFREGIPGWRTDRGRIYLIHGKPGQEETVTADVGRISGNSTMRGSRATSILWTYYEIPTARYYKGRMVLVFQPNIGMTEQDVTLGESRLAQQKAAELSQRAGERISELVDTAVRYRLVSAGPPAAVNSRGTDAPASGVGEYARYVEDLLRSPGDILEELDGEQTRQTASRSELREQIRTTVSFHELPLYFTCIDFYEASTSTVTVAWQFPISSIQLEHEHGTHRGRVDLVAQVRNELRETVDEWFKTIELKYTDAELAQLGGQDFRYLNEFHLPYGKYEIVSIARDVKSGRAGIASQSVVCSPMAEGKIALSGLVLSRGVVNAPASDVGKQLVLKGLEVVPEASLKFSRNDRLVLLFKIYNAQPSGDAPLVVINYDFHSGDKLVKSSGPRRLDQYTDAGKKVITYSATVDLSVFPAGTYSLQVNAIDFNTRHYAIERAQFEIR